MKIEVMPLKFKKMLHQIYQQKEIVEYISFVFVCVCVHVCVAGGGGGVKPILMSLTTQIKG